MGSSHPSLPGGSCTCGHQGVPDGPQRHHSPAPTPQLTPYDRLSSIVCASGLGCPLEASCLLSRVPELLVSDDGRAEPLSETALAEAFALARAILESATGGVIVTDLGGGIITYNRRFSELWPVTDDWLRQPVGQRLARFALQVKDGASFVERIQSLLADPEHESYDVIPMADGRMLDRYSRPFRSGERLVGRLWSYRDISERVAMEQAMSESERRFRQLVECSPDAIFVEALDGTILEVNPEACRLHGLTRAELVGRNVLSSEFIPQDQLATARAQFAQMASGALTRIESFSQTYDGRRIPVELQCSQIEYAGIPALLLQVRDISSRKAAEAALQRRDALLEAISAAAEHFLDTGDLEHHLPIMLAKLGVAAAVSRIYIFQNERGADGALLMSQRYEWCAPGSAPQLGNQALQQLPYGAGGFGRWEQILQQGQIIHGHVAGFPAGERSLLEAQQIRSLLVMPVRVGRHWWGFIGFADCGHERTWLAEEIDTLKIAARMVGAAIRRHEVEAELLHLNATLEQQVQQRTAELKHAYRRLEQSLADRTLAFQHLADSDARRRAMLEALPDSMILFRTSGDVLEWQAGDHDLPYPLGAQLEHLARVDPAAAQTMAQFHAAIAHVAATGATPIFEYAIQGEEAARWFEARLVLVDDERVLALIREITERKQNEAQLQQLALHDVLTGLPNRALLYDRMQQSLQRATRDPARPFGFLLLDIDDFKRINDSLGHGVGDDLLVAMARRLSGCLRAADTVARLGGDEFAVLLDQPQDLASIQRTVERMQRAVAAPFVLDERLVTVGISLGVVLYADWHRQAEDVLRDADIALYRAKARGKGQYAVFDATMHAQVIAEMVLETDLRRAIEQSELRVYYQPVMHLPTSQIHGFEALVRWQHPTLGLLTPGDFLPLAARIGLDVTIDRWVLAEACRQLQGWQRGAAQRPLYVSVNLSSKHLEHPDLVAYVGELLQTTGVAPARLMLEVTEHSLIDDNLNALATLSQLRQLGVRIGLDDFGTGYSSLSYLHRFPVDVLKIDRAFLRDQDPHGRNRVIMQALIKLAQTLGLEIIAEGAETAAHIEQLRAMGCLYVQGYYVARPLASDAAEAFLGRHASAPA